MGNNTSPRTLLVLGNGFDLSLHIKSKYSDFYNSELFKRNNSVWSYIIPILIPDAKSVDWMDVESAISRVLLSPELGILKTYDTPQVKEALNFIDEQIGFINRYQMWGNITMLEDFVFPKNQLNLAPLIFTISKLLRSQQDNQKLLEIIDYLSKNPYSKIQSLRQSPLNKDRPDDDKLDKMEKKLAEYYDEFLLIVSDFLLSELKIVECNFQEYLSSQIGDDYAGEACNKIRDLVGDSGSTSIDILNFNYTDLTGAASIFSPREMEVKINNIHGKLEKNNIIFGIDSHDDQKLADEQLQVLAQPFTKTSRKLRITEPSQFNIDSNIKSIVFFGHSLSDADYSYFDYIFNEVDLYSSECKLIFKYATAYDRENSQRIKGEICATVEKLIRRYQNTVGQPNNLFDRLLIQGRIQIIDIDEEDTAGIAVSAFND
ncbi:hypothetical protein R55227_BLOPHJLP_00436 [Fructobacillus tropaeoli]|uniref:AbiH family protein n=1 Tax=Fructobacillus tropaeoli TaxID=709323 RepID=UPI002D82C8A4|nr:hypothetical protein R55227_BLOPHJLP_00436 [Fructobacillus tropaeoli]